MIKKTYFILLAAAMNLCIISAVFGVQAPPYPVWLSQPDGTKFQARIFGNEFLNWTETLEGFTIMKNSDGFYCYATTSPFGELQPSSLIVGKVSLDEIPYQKHLQPGANEKAAAKKAYQEWAEGGMIESTTGTIKLGVILIALWKEDFKWKKYDAEDFENMLFSESDWDGPGDHPDGDEVFGSLKNYYQEVSYGNLEIIGDVLNARDGDNFEPLEADYGRPHYEALPDNSNDLIDEAIDKANAKHDQDPINWKDPDDYDKTAVIYSGGVSFAGALWPHTEYRGGKA